MTVDVENRFEARRGMVYWTASGARGQGYLRWSESGGRSASGGKKPHYHSPCAIRWGWFKGADLLTASIRIWSLLDW